MSNFEQAIDYRAASVETAHEAALAENSLRNESNELWNRYYEGLSTSNCMAELVEYLPDKAVQKRVEGDVASTNILERELLGDNYVEHEVPQLPPKAPNAGQPETHTPVGILQRIRLGRLATYFASATVPAVVATAITGEPTYIEAAGYIDALMVGGALYGGHQHHVNHYPRNSSPLKSVVKDRSEV